ncbi:hypothetical protein C8F04DRAFT_1196461 [Mycena alexandri]|uniref:Uncharacterized protein n=1 Tax=Mycena alexandri TaxID=1745969 RepID=A0AAD6WPT1_9AGAR|nr:hypothetical protein C8F04DRAFT_1196461 [Mycena alexandri]
MAVNIITTCLLLYRIWRIAELQWGLKPNADEYMSRLTPAKLASASIVPSPVYSRVKHTKRLLIESGLIYTTATIITFSLFTAHNNAVYASIDVLVQIIGIAFNLIIIHNHSHAAKASQAQLNDVELQIISSNRTQSVPASAIEFAYPKQFVPQHKHQPTRAPGPTQEDNGSSGILGILQNSESSQQSTHSIS